MAGVSTSTGYDLAAECGEYAKGAAILAAANAAHPSGTLLAAQGMM
jgi:hypothetical protein